MTAIMESNQHEPTLTMELVTETPMTNEEEKRSPAEAENNLPDRRQNPWTNPQFLVQVLLIVVGVAVATQVRTAGLENAAANLNEKATRMEAQVTSIAGSVQVISTQSAEMRATQAAQATQIADLKQSVQMYEARIIVLEKAVARAEARSDVR
jgi:hypothetical protein